MLIRGTFVQCPKLGELVILSDWLAAVDDSGYITHFENAESSTSLELQRVRTALILPLGTFLLPPFNDLHLHAPQFLYQGTGLDLPLLEWLHQYAFKAEEKLDSDPVLARTVYRRLGQRLVKAGTGAVCLFGTLKGDTNMILAEEMQSTGIRAYVGKVSMDISSRPSYIEASSSAAVDAARAFGEKLEQTYSVTSQSRPSLVHPVITPRFVPTCSDELLHGLGALSAEKGWRIQSHMAESSDQVEWVRKERGEDDIHIFKKHNLLTSRTIQAHCTFISSSSPPSSKPFVDLHALGTAIAHCPLSNIYFSASRAFPLREALEAQIKIGLGTDIAGGYSLDVMSAMRMAVAVSRIREGERVRTVSSDHGKSLAIDWKESLFLATLGGAQALGIDSGIFTVGAPFDAQQIRLFDPRSGIGAGALDFFELEMVVTKCHEESYKKPDLTEEMIEKWWCIGDERNREAVWVQGVKIFG
ncbi:Metallo-dependent hydrolase [Lentinula edodes]|uniref:Metallo-dependent hydrolase n=1 Tax=Lentinula edodes TaxID=5353 RepID=UPI001E8CD641|nr:Metallo-dependent hydrolase [Lentinula edodes]KAH7870908.1 Metallo-dependent hydrolase [Lentinula edodes]